ncbi:MAG: nitroreductase family protein [Tannerella sp.]|nr:nitroreductase family protein [Tannerella sp.]
MQPVIKLAIVFCSVFLFACQGKSGRVSQSGESSANDDNSKLISQKYDAGSSVVQNQTLQTILNRKSVRDYTGQEISPDIMEQLLRAGMAAPSSKDRRPWHFIVISDKVILENLGTQLKNASCLKGADKAIVVCGDDELSDNCWFLDCSAATQNILIAAEALGLGAVWTAVYPYDDRAGIVNKTFNLNKNIHPFAIIPLGYPLEESEAKDKFDESRIHYDKW